MNKTVTINISGIIFHIEEDAFEKLSKYLNTIRGYFRNSEGYDEIMGDIESRIAEMLQEKVNSVKQVVLMTDVDYVISVMGKPEDFAEGAIDNSDTNGYNAGTSSEAYAYKRRRVFRDKDDAVLGGVCSGVSSYFGIDPLWIRLAFAVSFFVFGSGFLLYIILWMIIPEAKTAAEKLEMRGDPVNVDNIGKTINEEMENVKKRMGKVADDVNSPQTRERVRSAGSRFGNFMTDLIKGFVRVFVKVIAVFAAIIAGIILVALLASYFGVGNINFNVDGIQTSYTMSEFLARVIGNEAMVPWAYIGSFLLIGIPLLMIIYGGIKLLFGIKGRNKYVHRSATVLWAVGLIISLFVGFNVLKDFKEVATSKQVITLVQPQSDTLILRVKQSAKYNFEYSDEDEAYEEGDDNEGTVKVKHRHRRFRDRHLNWNDVSFDIIPNDKDSFELAIFKSAHALTKKEAITLAKNIQYNFYQKDSLLELDQFFNISKDDKWRDQEIKLVLKVPRGKVVYLSSNMRHIIYDIDNVTNTWDWDMVGRRWIMDNEGLRCLDCRGINKEDDDDWDQADEVLAPVHPVPPAPPAHQTKTRH